MSAVVQIVKPWMARSTISGNSVFTFFRQHQGYIYLWTLFSISLAGVALAGLGQMWQTTAQREKEIELLYVGDQFRLAIEAFYNNATSANRSQRYPESLSDLLKDEGAIVTKRYLRKIYMDPITNSFEWGLIKQGEKGITGVYSLSTKTPIKRAKFPEQYTAFSKAKSYQDWKFNHASGTSSQGRQQTQPNTSSGAPGQTQNTNPFTGQSNPSGQNRSGSANPFPQNQPDSNRTNPFSTQ